MTSTRGAEDHDRRAQSAYARGEYERAVVDATRAIELQPAMARYYRSRGRIFAALGYLSAARQDYQRGAALGDSAAQHELWTL